MLRTRLPHMGRCRTRQLAAGMLPIVQAISDSREGWWPWVGWCRSAVPCGGPGWRRGSVNMRRGASLGRYRAPELLLGTTTQTTSIDMW